MEKIKLTYAFFNNKDLEPAVNLIFDCRAYDPLKAYKLSKFCSEVLEHNESAKRGFIKLLKQHSKLDEKGVPLGITTGQYQFETPEKAKEFEVEYDKFIATEVEVDFRKLQPRDLAPAQLSGRNIKALDVFLDKENWDE